MGLPAQTISLLGSARQLSQEMQTDAVLILADSGMDWDEVLHHLGDVRVLVAAHDKASTEQLEGRNGCVILELDPEPVPIKERMSSALLKAIANEQIRPGSHVVVLYNGINFDHGRAEPLDSLSVMHLDEHLERMSAADLRRLDTLVPLDTLRLVVDLATEIGRE